MKKIILLSLGLLSLNAMAGYECKLSLSHMDNFHQSIASLTTQVGTNQMESGNAGTLFLESETPRKRISLGVNAVMSGWDSEEDAAFVIMRRVNKKNSSSAERVSEVIGLKGNQTKTGWFEGYKVDIDCKIK